MPKLVYPDRCPECGYTLARSRRRGWIEKLVVRCFRIGVFRCLRCRARFYAPPSLFVHAAGSKERDWSTKDSAREDRSDVLPDGASAAPSGKPVDLITLSQNAFVSERRPSTQDAVTDTRALSPSTWLRSTADSLRRHPR